MYSWITLQPLYPVLASVGSWDCCCCWRLWENKIVTKTWYKKCIYPIRKFQKAKTAQFYKTRILEQVLRQISKWGRELTPVSATFEYSEPFISFHTKHRWKEGIFTCVIFHPRIVGTWTRQFHAMLAACWRWRWK